MFKDYFFKIIIFTKKKFIGFKKIDQNYLKKKTNQDYQNEDLIKLILLKNKEFRKKKNNYILEDKYLFDKLLSKKGQIRVLDLGGGGGHTYLTFKRNYPFINFIWYNYETTALVKLFKKKLKIEKKLIFTDKLEDIPNKIDLLYCNSSLQYIKDQSEFIKKILKKKIKYIYITRTFFNHNDLKTVAAIQQTLLSENGPGKVEKNLFKEKIIEYPVFIFSKKKFENTIKKKYFEISKKKNNNDFIIVEGVKYFSFMYCFKSKI